MNIKEKQLEIILKYNKGPDNQLSWIRSTNDILDFKDVLNDADYAGCDIFTPDFHRKDAVSAMNKGKIMVYSSFPIKQGVFVTPSKIEAKNYAGNKKVYSKFVNIEDIAWIDILQGQYANVKELSTIMDKTNFEIEK